MASPRAARSWSRSPSEPRSGCCRPWTARRRRRQVRTLLGLLMLGGLAESLLGAVQFLFQIGPPSFAVGRFLRAYGTFGQPNPYGGYLAMVLPIAVAIVWTHAPSVIARARHHG